MYDLIVFCPEKKRLWKRWPATDIYIEKEKRYWDIWKYLTVQKGKWYSLLTVPDEIGGSKLCETIDLDRTIDLPDVPKEVRECLTPYRIRRQFLGDFKKILNYLLDCSALKTVYVLARYQSDDKEVVLGTYSVDTFLSLMEAGRVYSNICYIISNQPNAL